MITVPYSPLSGYMKNDDTLNALYYEYAITSSFFISFRYHTISTRIDGIFSQSLERKVILCDCNHFFGDIILTKQSFQRRTKVKIFLA